MANPYGIGKPNALRFVQNSSSIFNHFRVYRLSAAHLKVTGTGVPLEVGGLPLKPSGILALQLS